MEAFALMAIMALAQTDDTSITSVEQDNGRLTLDVSLGASWVDDLFGQELDPGVFGSIGIGYELTVTDTAMVSVEFEYSQHNGDASGSFDVFREIGKGGDYNIAWNGDVQSHVFMLNGMWTQTLFSDNLNGFLVYGGLGIGYADNSGNLDLMRTGRYNKSDKTRHFDASDGGFAWQALFGIGWRFNERSKVYVGGRYADLGMLHDALDLDVESLVFEVGYTISF